MEIFDADNNLLKEGDRVYCYDLDGQTKVYGTIHYNDIISNTWYIKYDDGDECLVLDFAVVWKVN